MVPAHTMVLFIPESTVLVLRMGNFVSRFWFKRVSGFLKLWRPRLEGLNAFREKRKPEYKARVATRAGPYKAGPSTPTV